MERLLTCKEVSNILGYPKDIQCRFVKGLRRKGVLEGAKIGNRLMFKESDVQEYIDRQFKIQNR